MNQSREPVRHEKPWVRPVILIAIGMLFGVIALGLGASSLWKVREQSQRAYVRNNLSYFAKALHNFDSAFGGLPPALGGGYRATAGKGDADTFLPVAGAGVVFVGGPGAVVTKRFQFAALTTHGFLLPYMEEDS